LTIGVTFKTLVFRRNAKKLAENRIRVFQTCCLSQILTTNLILFYFYYKKCTTKFSIKNTLCCLYTNCLVNPVKFSLRDWWFESWKYCMQCRRWVAECGRFIFPCCFDIFQDLSINWPKDLFTKPSIHRFQSKILKRYSMLLIFKKRYYPIFMIKFYSYFKFCGWSVSHGEKTLHEVKCRREREILR